MSDASSWFEIPSPFETAPGSVLLADPPNAGARKLRAMLLDETYPKPFVIDDGELLTLYFNIRLIQSVMRLKTPNTLELRYTRKMMSFLLFNPSPKRIALIGMGGGSLVKFCHQRLPSAQVTAIELDPDVIAFRDIFKVPPDGSRLQVLQADGAAYLASAGKGIDVLLVDAFDKIGLAPALANREFFESAFARLSPQGQFIINLAGDKRRFRGLIDEVTDVFDGRVIVVPVRGDGNSVLLAFKDARFKPNWRLLHRKTKVLQDKFGLDFPDYARKIEIAAKR
ncbi:Spermidine synthase-like protein [Georgfuchsia toluolica]|uniref:Spermidine synthase-like protein n=1 Tax=Georgfuchsia toluolica TaxID=424218 RepID=A0A916N8C6_9PROT|nr:fused MFS/spermidine synthase [Georgfuchsia toluolica]CAG4883107.1 Spermidine synthase-like protein [Georgfuchsia toluolica]